MSFSSVLVFHICVGALGLLSGAVALSLRKGSRQHRVAGNAFVITMLSMAASAVYLGLVKHQTENWLKALLTAYLVASAWRTARRRDESPGAFEFGVFTAAVALGIGFVICGVRASTGPEGTADGHAALKYFIFGVVTLFASVGDLRILMRGGVFGAHRIARHLWRMSLSLLIAAYTLFHGQAKIFPDVLRKTRALDAPMILILVVMVFWLGRVLFTHGQKEKAAIFYRLRT